MSCGEQHHVGLRHGVAHNHQARFPGIAYGVGVSFHLVNMSSLGLYIR